MENKQNCWEYMECGREPKGFDVQMFDVCSVPTYTEADGLNDGKNGGRICWALAGTLINDTVTGKYACDKFSCANCDFFKLVCDEQGVNNFQMVTPVQMTHFKKKNSEVWNQFIEKRSSERSPSNLNACFRCCNMDYSGTVKNISETGMFISTRNMSFPDDAQFEVQLDVNNEYLNLPVRMCRLTISPDLDDAMGVEIINPPQSYLVMVDKLRAADLS